MNGQGLVTVIVPVRNRPALLREAVASIVVQTHSEWELLIVDDGSTDETPESARALAHEHGARIRLLSSPATGPGGAREVGRSQARGEFIQYLDSDDLLRPRKLELQIAALRSAPEALLAYGPVEILRPDGVRRDHAPQQSNRRLERMFPEFLRRRYWHTGAALLRREASDAVGPWSDLRLFEDWEYDCRLALLDRPLAFVPETGVTIRSLAENRLGFSLVREPWRLKQQARAHELILGHARRARIGAEVPEMAQFARSLFLLARECGRAGLRTECLRLVRLAREASTPERARGADFLFYRILVTLLGVRLGSGLAERLRGSLRGEADSAEEGE